MPGYRGRLIWPQVASIRRLDTVATASQPSTIGGGYDPDFREPVILPDGSSARAEQDEIRVPCQVRTESGAFDMLQMFGASGASPGFRMRIVLHYEDLEELGLVDVDTGRPVFVVGDRLAAIYTADTDELVRRFDSPQLFATQVQDRSFGLSALRRNLLEITFEDREAAVRGQPT